MEDKVPAELKRAVRRIPTNGYLCREISETLTAAKYGGGFLYFIEPSGKRFSPSIGRRLVEGEYVQPANDGLFGELSQTFTVPERLRGIDE